MSDVSASSAGERLKTGIDRLDGLLGGGLLPGTLTVVLGSTGIGKTQLGLQFARQGELQEGQRGILFDLTSRGDSQNHRDYARRLFGWDLSQRSADAPFEPAQVWDPGAARCDYLHVFDRSGRRVSIGDLEQEEWREWKIELARKLDRSIAFFYGNFIHGVRRCVIDGIEPAERASDSFQFHVFDYVYHQILRKDADWLARDLFRAQFRANERQVALHAYDPRTIGCLLLCTSKEILLEQLIERSIETGDVLTNANTIILLGKVHQGSRMGRALHVAKHRGSACDESIVPFEITEQGLRL
ncbi:MAG TPA: ATPase domain-containing protein [Planctomycetaceae bacterium]|jgi:KaiC/GvpD/RAD55 family RecA-like ATPase|nr:ATPase domain-containing protein [Planctomycetaceae bacterium]